MSETTQQPVADPMAAKLAEARSDIYEWLRERLPEIGMAWDFAAKLDHYIALHREDAEKRRTG